MVVFTCNHCGDSLQKPRVEKHYQTTCRRNSKSMTCVDCLKDFRLEEYAVHTKCVTETERYAAKGTVVGVPKGEKKQESWVETVQNVIEEHKHNVSQNIKIIFDIIVKHTNIPKKKKPFINYLMNSAGRMIRASDIEEVWNIMEKYKTDHNIQSTKIEKNKENDSKKSDKLDTAEETAQTNGEDKNKKKKKSKKNKNNETNGETEKQTVNGDEENNTEENNKSKKKRKSKDESVEVEDVPGKKQKLDEVETPQENGEKKSKKKKRKSEKIEENKTESEESKIESITKEAQTPEENGEKKSKKKKRKSEKIEENSTEPEENKTELEESKTEINNEKNTIKDTDKSSKKKKRKLQSEEVQENNEINGIIENGEQKIEETSSKKKRKKLQNQEKETKQNELNGNAENGENQTKKPTAKNKIIKKDKFQWGLVIEQILTKKYDGIHKDKLQKKAFKIFEKEKGVIDNEKKKEDLIKHFNKKLQSHSNLIVDNDLVKLRNLPFKPVIIAILKNEPDGVQEDELKTQVFKKYAKFNDGENTIEKNAKFDQLFIRKLRSIKNKTTNNNIIKFVA